MNNTITIFCIHHLPQSVSVFVEFGWDHLCSLKSMEYRKKSDQTVNSTNKVAAYGEHGIHGLNILSIQLFVVVVVIFGSKTHNHHARLK